MTITTMIIMAKNIAKAIANVVVTAADCTVDTVYFVLLIDTIIFAGVKPTQSTL